ncbi:MAG: hypothetical protein JNG88_11880 [Phycisphaerales bacterium]|nr:hypothetical protein [Phycisphaerales bacterium]
MPWIHQIQNAEATGTLKRLFDEALKRAGKVFNIVRIQSLNPPALEASMNMYRVLMFGLSPLSRAQRELLATIVSKANACHY